MSAASNFEKMAGVVGPTFHVGQTGPMLSASAGAFEARASNGSSLTIFRGAPPVGTADFVNLGFLSSALGASALAGISAGATQASTGTVVFSNSNGVSFGMTGNTITGSVSVPPAIGLGAGTQTATSGTIVFADGNGVTFGMSGSSQVTASVSQITVPSALSAGAGLASSGTVIFSNSNGVSFGIVGQTLTASIFAGGGNGEYVAAGTQTATVATVVFANANNVTFGMGGLSQVTASASYAPTLAFFENLSGVMWQGATFASLSVVPLAANIFPGLMTASTFLFGLNGVSSQSTAAGSMLFSFGLYTLNGSTLSLLNSVATSLTYAAVSNNSTAYTGFRWLSIHSSQWSSPPVFSQTNYWLGYIVSSSNATQGMNFIGQAFANAQARWGTVGVAAGAPAGSYGWRPMMGAYTATTSQFPTSIGQGDLNASFTNVGNFLPHVILNAAMSNF